MVKHSVAASLLWYLNGCFSKSGSLFLLSADLKRYRLIIDDVIVSEANVPASNMKNWTLHWREYLAEFIGTALLLLFGLSLVIVVFGKGSPASHLIPSIKIRQIITGFLFGCIGALIAVSPVGKVSGAHINPVVTLGFRMMGKLNLRTTVAYIIVQMAGAVFGCLPLLMWGPLGKSVAYGATLPGKGYETITVVMGEAVTTFALIAALCLFLGFRRMRPFTPLMIPILYAVMVPLEAAISGTSTNPARTFGPAIISGQWFGWWIYWVGPLLGMLAGILSCSFLARRIEVAKLYHFESDRRRFFQTQQE
jgi:aquaporin Z